MATVRRPRAISSTYLVVAPKRGIVQVDPEIERLERSVRELRQALEAKTRELAKANAALETIPALVWSADSNGSADFMNQHYLDFVGFSAERAQGMNWTELVHPDDLDGLFDGWRRIAASGKSGEVEARFRRFDGEYRWFLCRCNHCSTNAARSSSGTASTPISKSTSAPSGQSRRVSVMSGSESSKR